MPQRQRQRGPNPAWRDPRKTWGKKRRIILTEGPKAQFVKSGNPPPDANTYEFANTSYDMSDPMAELDSYWSFGDGESSGDKNPEHTFPTLVEDAEYTITLLVTNPDTGYSGRTSQTITIPGTGVPPPGLGPTARLTLDMVNTDPGDPTNTVHVVTGDASGSTAGSSAIVAFTFAWLSADPQPGVPLQNGTTTGTHQGTGEVAAGTYTLQVTVTDAFGLSDTATAQYTVAGAEPPPTATATTESTGVAPAVAGENGSITATQTVEPPGDGITVDSIRWTLEKANGDFVTTTAETGPHLGTDPVTGNLANLPGIEPASLAALEAGREWNIDQLPPGDYTITTEMTLSDGTVTTSTEEITIPDGPPGPDVGPTAKLSLAIDNTDQEDPTNTVHTVTGDASGSTAGSSEIVSYTFAWLSPDPQPGVPLQNGTTTGIHQGTGEVPTVDLFILQVTVTDANGLTDTATAERVVGGTPPPAVAPPFPAPEPIPPIPRDMVLKADFIYTADRRQIPYKINTYDYSQAGFYPIVDWQWTVGNNPSGDPYVSGAPYNGPGGTVFIVNGNYTGLFPVTLTVTDSNGDTDSVTKFVTSNFTINPGDGPDVRFDIVRTPNPDGEGGIFQVYDKTSPRGLALTAWRWDWGDGTFSFNQAPGPHVYDAPGIYQVTLTVVDVEGNVGTHTKEIEITPPPPSGDPTAFDITPLTVDYKYRLDMHMVGGGGGSEQPNDTIFYDRSRKLTRTDKVTGEVTSPEIARWTFFPGDPSGAPTVIDATEDTYTVPRPSFTADADDFTTSTGWRLNASCIDPLFPEDGDANIDYEWDTGLLFVPTPIINGDSPRTSKEAWFTFVPTGAPPFGAYRVTLTCTNRNDGRSRTVKDYLDINRLTAAALGLENYKHVYEWSPIPFFSHQYDSSGLYPSFLRVTDYEGNQHHMTRLIPILDDIGPEAKFVADLVKARDDQRTPNNSNSTTFKDKSSPGPDGSAIAKREMSFREMDPSIKHNFDPLDDKVAAPPQVWVGNALGNFLFSVNDYFIADFPGVEGNGNRQIEVTLKVTDLKLRVHTYTDVIRFRSNTAPYAEYVGERPKDQNPTDTDIRLLDDSTSEGNPPLPIKTVEYFANDGTNTKIKLNKPPAADWRHTFPPVNGQYRPRMLVTNELGEYDNYSKNVTVYKR